MKLITFQSKEALKFLINNGYLICDDKYVDKIKSDSVYKWLIQKMNKSIPNKENVNYPLWCWVKYKKYTCPPKHKGTKIKGYDVKITFHKNEKDIFITDYRRFSFLLNNAFIPTTLKEKEYFEQKLKKMNITNDELKAFIRRDKYKSHRTDKSFLNICNEIKESFDKCITNDSDILQGCIWSISIDEVEKIEFLNDENYINGSLNYIRSNGHRINWREDFYKKLK